jgi:S1-C subfamily serine protease
MREDGGRRRIGPMVANTLTAFSEQIADAVAAVAPSVVQVQGRRRPVSGVAYTNTTVLTTARALGREDGIVVRTPDGTSASAELVGWDPASGLALLKVEGVGLTPAEISDATLRVGQIVLGAARSWSNALTASAGIIAVIGGPLRTGHGRSLEQVIRITAPMHDGFSGGAVIDASGRLVGVATAAQIRGLGVVIPGAVAWKIAAQVLMHGAPKTGFLGISGQGVQIPEGQRADSGRDRGLLVIAVTPDSPAATGGVLLGDIILELEQHLVGSTSDVIELLTGDRVGRTLPLRVLRGGVVRELSVTVGARSDRQHG